MMVIFDTAPMVEGDFQKNNVACSFAAADESCTLGFSKSIKVRICWQRNCYETVQTVTFYVNW